MEVMETDAAFNHEFNLPMYYTSLCLPINGDEILRAQVLDSRCIQLTLCSCKKSTFKYEHSHKQVRNIHSNYSLRIWDLKLVKWELTGSNRIYFIYSEINENKTSFKFYFLELNCKQFSNVCLYEGPWVFLEEKIENLYTIEQDTKVSIRSGPEIVFYSSCATNIYVLTGKKDHHTFHIVSFSKMCSEKLEICGFLNHENFEMMHSELQDVPSVVFQAKEPDTLRNGDDKCSLECKNSIDLFQLASDYKITHTSQVLTQIENYQKIFEQKNLSASLQFNEDASPNCKFFSSCIYVGLKNNLLIQVESLTNFLHAVKNLITHLICCPVWDSSTNGWAKITYIATTTDIMQVKKNKCLTSHRLKCPLYNVQFTHVIKDGKKLPVLILHFQSGTVEIVSINLSFLNDESTLKVIASLTDKFYQVLIANGNGENDGYNSILLFPSEQIPSQKTINDSLGNWMSLRMVQNSDDQIDQSEENSKLGSVVQAMKRHLELNRSHLVSEQLIVSNKNRFFQNAKHLLSNAFKNFSLENKNVNIENNLNLLVTTNEALVDSNNSDCQERKQSVETTSPLTLVSSNCYLTSFGEYHYRVQIRNNLCSSLLIAGVLLVCEQQSLKLNASSVQLVEAEEICTADCFFALEHLNCSEDMLISACCEYVKVDENIGLDRIHNIKFFDSWCIECFVLDTTQLWAVGKSVCCLPYQRFFAIFSKNNSSLDIVSMCLKRHLDFYCVSNIRGQQIWESYKQNCKITIKIFLDFLEMDFEANVETLLDAVVSLFVRSLPQDISVVDNPLKSQNLQKLEQFIEAVTAELQAVEKWKKYLLENPKMQLQKIYTQKFDPLKLLILWKKNLAQLQFKTDTCYATIYELHQNCKNAEEFA